jgi:thiamine biosynthesis lipoprotein
MGKRIDIQHEHFPSMGTRFDLVLVGVDRRKSAAVTRLCRAELERLESKLSRYRSDSVISLINQRAYGKTLVLDAEMQGVFREIDRLHAESGGYFDIALPTGWSGVAFNGDSISFPEPGMELDLGGYGKGYALRCILPILEAEGVESALLSFGESMVYGLGTHPYGDHWPISLAGDGGEAEVFKLVNAALSTSGNTLNNQKKFANSGHIVNPVTGTHVSSMGLVSVKSEDPVLCEVYSTALFAAGPGNEDEVLQYHPGLEYRWSGIASDVKKQDGK